MLRGKSEMGNMEEIERIRKRERKKEEKKKAQ